MQTSERNHHFRLGAVKTMPLALGVAPFGFAYGVLSLQAGLTVAETVLMSLLVFAGAAQFMAVGMFASAAGGLAIVLSTLLINLRHLMMGLSISPYLSKSTPRWQRVLAFGMSDESYLVAITHYREQGTNQGSPHLMLGSALAIYLVWAFSSLAGALFGSEITDPLKWGLDFIMPVTFLTMLLPQIKSVRLVSVVAVATVAATASYVLLPGAWYIIIAVVSATITGVVLETRAEKAIPS